MAENRTIRKFIDLVRQTSGKWTNWDPPIPIAVGDFGTLDKNGELSVEGNIYDPDFQEYLKSELKIDLGASAHQPELGEPEQDYIVASTGVRKGEFNVNQSVNIPAVVSASIRGTWAFQKGKRGALIILHLPRQKFLPKLVQTKILAAKRLEGKQIVTSALACPAYLMYLSDKSGEHVSVAFCGSTVMPDAVSGEVGAGWWTNNESALLRRAFNPKGEHRFTPLFSLREKVKRRSFFSWPSRGEDEPESSADGEYIWQDVFQPWIPLDEDGEEVVEE